MGRRNRRQGCGEDDQQRKGEPMPYSPPRTIADHPGVAECTALDDGFLSAEEKCPMLGIYAGRNTVGT